MEDTTANRKKAVSFHVEPKIEIIEHRSEWAAAAAAGGRGGGGESVCVAVEGGDHRGGARMELLQVATSCDEPYASSDYTLRSREETRAINAAEANHRCKMSLLYILPFLVVWAVLTALSRVQTAWSTEAVLSVVYMPALILVILLTLAYKYHRVRSAHSLQRLPQIPPESSG